MIEVCTGYTHRTREIVRGQGKLQRYEVQRDLIDESQPAHGTDHITTREGKCRFIMQAQAETNS